MMAMLLLCPENCFAQAYAGTINIKKGEEYYVDVDTKYSYQMGTWYKSNSTFVFVNQGRRGCTIRGNQVGTGRLEYNGMFGSGVEYKLYWNVVVTTNEKKKVSSITLSETYVELEEDVKEGVQLTATVYPSDAYDKSVTWSSSNTDVVWVHSQTGLVIMESGSKTGKSIITCAANDGSGVKATCEVIVKPKGSSFIQVSSLQLDKKEIKLGVGDRYSTLKATILPSNASNKKLKWTSSNTNVAKVSYWLNDELKNDVSIEAVGTGTATITCTPMDGSSVSASCVVNVSAQSHFKAKTVEGVEVLYQVLDESAKTCRVGFYSENTYFDGSSNSGGLEKAIDVNTTGTITIPERVNGYSVVEICENAFQNCESITTVHLPSCLTCIGSYAFSYCKSLTNLTGTDNLEYIGSDAFYGYPDIPYYANMADGPVYIGKVLYTYKGSPSESIIVNVKEGTTCISGRALGSISGVVVPKSVKYFGAVKDEYGYGYTPLGSWMASIVVSPDNEVYDSRDNCNAVIETKTNKLVAGCETTIIPNTVTAIGRYAFGGNMKTLSSVVIPDNVRVIEKEAFRDNYQIDYLYIGAGVEAIEMLTDGYTTFTNTRLNRIEVSKDNKHYDSRNDCNAIIETATNKLVAGGYQTIIPQGVKIIGRFALQNTQPLIVIPDGVEVIEKDAFMNGAKYLHIGYGLKEAYYLSPLAIHSSDENPNDLNEYAFSNSTYENCTLFVPVGSKSKYESKTGWSKFKNIIEGDGYIDGEIIMATTIEGHKLKFKILSNADKTCELVGPANNDIAGKVTIPGSVNGYTVTSIGKNAFYSDNLGNYYIGKDVIAVDIPNSVISIGNGAFERCESLSVITGGENVETIGSYAFSQTPWSNILLPSSLKSIGEYAFYSTKGSQTQTVKSLVAEPFSISDNVFFYNTTYRKGKLIVPEGTKALYEALDGWKNFKNIVETGPAPTDIKLPSTETVMVGEEIVLQPTFTPENAYAELIWTSDDETIATVDANGVVKGIKKGQTFINVETDNGKIAYCKLTVTAGEPTAISLPKNVTLHVGENVTLPPTITPEGAETTLTWKSDDESVVLVNADGVLTGVAEGLALVTVTTSNGLTSNACKVKVEADPSGITDVQKSDNKTSVFSLSGQRLTAPRKGINIVGGKKVVVK